MKNKKGFILGIVWAVMIMIILGLLIWFGFRISEGLSTFFNFLKVWWWAIALSFLTFTFREQIKAILNTILRKLGVSI